MCVCCLVIVVACVVAFVCLFGVVFYPFPGTKVGSGLSVGA